MCQISEGFLIVVVKLGHGFLIASQARFPHGHITTVTWNLNSNNM